jgi:HlyD family secretion protein
MSGSVDIYTETVENAVAVPIQAVTVRDFNEVAPDANDDSGSTSGAQDEDLRRVVFVASADTARMVEVSTGIADDTHMQVRSGLDGGEQVITGPYKAVSQELKPGDKIQTDTKDSGSGAQVMATTQ